MILNKGVMSQMLMTLSEFTRMSHVNERNLTMQFHLLLPFDGTDYDRNNDKTR